MHSCRWLGRQLNDRLGEMSAYGTCRRFDHTETPQGDETIVRLSRSSAST